MTDTKTRAEHSTDIADKQLQIDDCKDGLTDDQRASRETDSKQSGARVQPGPADRERDAQN